MSKTLGLAILFTVAACGDNGLPNNGGDGGTGKDAAPTADLTMAAADLSVPPTEDLAVSNPQDLTYFTRDADGVSCGMQSCAVGEQCCATQAAGGITFMCAATCPMDGGTVTLACDGPEDCMQNPCCAAIGTGANGQPSTSGAMCTSSPTDCSPAYDFQSKSGQTRFCHVDQDCVSGAPSSMFPDCCTAKDSKGNQTHICFAKAYVAFTGGAITCP